MYEKYTKRILDVLFSLITFILLSPLLIILIILGVAIMKGNPFFIQKRPGMIDTKTGKEHIFPLMKLRSMTNEKDEEGQLLSNEKRLNAYGKWLRSTSLDELPSLLNIIAGDLSLVGPRPLLVKYLPLYSEHQRKRHEVRPGLTGYAQAHGRNSISWEEKFEMDIWYVENISFLTDMRIVFDTVKTVLKREGINGNNTVTMEEFKGSRDITEIKNA